MTRDALHKLVDAVTEEAVPILFRAMAGLVNGHSTEEVLNQGERDVLAASMQKSFDEALKHAKG